MSGFDLVFAVFGLLLGLAVAEVLGGFSRAIKLKRGARPVRIGWLTPLLGIFVMLDLTSFWMAAWEAREQVGANYLTLIAVLVIVGIYYLAATLIFPEDPEAWPDFDDWYDRHKRMVVGGLLTANIGNMIGQSVLEELKATPDVTFGPLAIAVLLSGLGLFLTLVALLFVRGRRWNVAMLVALIAMMLFVGIGEDMVV